MKALLDQVGCFAEEYAKFFFAEMLLAVDTLHKMGYVHRDLKPDNFLIDRSGHMKLIDFGLSKDGLNQKYSSTFNLKVKKSNFSRCHFYLTRVTLIDICD